MIDGWGISCELALRWMSLNLTDDKSTLVLVMAWCHQAISHYLSQYWPRSLSPYGVTRPQWVKEKEHYSTGKLPHELDIESQVFYHGFAVWYCNYRNKTFHFEFSNVLTMHGFCIQGCLSFLDGVYDNMSVAWPRNIKPHDDVIKWKHFLYYWPFVRGIHRLPVNSPHKGQWRGALMFSLICAWIDDCINNREAGDLSHHHAHYDVTVMRWYSTVMRWYSIKLKNHTVPWNFEWAGV